MSNDIWELVEYDCIDGECLMIRNIPNDSKLGALSLDHRSIGEAIIEELNNLEQRIQKLSTKDELNKKRIDELRNWVRELDLERIRAQNKLNARTEIYEIWRSYQGNSMHDPCTRERHYVFLDRDKALSKLEECNSNVRAKTFYLKEVRTDD